MMKWSYRSFKELRELKGPKGGQKKVSIELRGPVYDGRVSLSISTLDSGWRVKVGWGGEGGRGNQSLQIIFNSVGFFFNSTF